MPDTDAIIERAKHLTAAERRRFLEWRTGPTPDANALWSQRTMAVVASQDRARDAGRSQHQTAMMDAAFRAVAASAGCHDAISYSDEEEWPQADWEPAATTAAETVAALVVADLIPAEMLAFIVEPWDRLLDNDEAMSTNLVEDRRWLHYVCMLTLGDSGKANYGEFVNGFRCPGRVVSLHSQPLLRDVQVHYDGPIPLPGLDAEVRVYPMSPYVWPPARPGDEIELIVPMAVIGRCRVQSVAGAAPLDERR